MLAKFLYRQTILKLYFFKNTHYILAQASALYQHLKQWYQQIEQMDEEIWPCYWLLSGDFWGGGGDKDNKQTVGHHWKAEPSSPPHTWRTAGGPLQEAKTAETDSSPPLWRETFWIFYLHSVAKPSFFCFSFVCVVYCFPLCCCNTGNFSSNPNTDW